MTSFHKSAAGKRPERSKEVFPPKKEPRVWSRSIRKKPERWLPAISDSVHTTCLLPFTPIFPGYKGGPQEKAPPGQFNPENCWQHKQMVV